MSLQYDLDVCCNGVDYILRVQPYSRCRVAALQAVRIYPDAETGRKEYRLVEKNTLLTALLEIIIDQGTGKLA